MEISHFTTYASKDLTSGGTALKQNKIIPLIWNVENITPEKWDRIVNGETICGPDLKFYHFVKALWKLEISNKRKVSDNSYCECHLSMAIRKVSEYESSAFQFEFAAFQYYDGVIAARNKFWKKKVSVPANVREHELFQFQNLSSEAEYFDITIIIKIDDNIAQEIANSVTSCRQAELQSSLDQRRLNVLADIENILTEAKFTDVILRSEGKEIRAHRAILGARSEVFEKMFEHQMSENASGRVEITDVPYDILQLLVTYMYSGRLVDLDVKSASALFAASDKYAIQDLHSTCSLFLKRSFTVENCLDILVLADTHSNEDLKSSTMAYFSEHSKEIFQIPEWENVIAARPTISFELLKVLSSKC